MEENLPVNPLEFGLSQGRAWEATELLCLCLWLVSQHKADAKAAALHLFRFECHAMLCCWFCLNCDLWQSQFAWDSPFQVCECILASY